MHTSIQRASTYYPVTNVPPAHSGAIVQGTSESEHISDRRDGGNPRALIVDDAPDITFMLAFLLEQSGYEVVTANSGSEALESTKQERFDVVITDIGMPDMNGYELAEALRRLPDYSTVPLVAMTGFAEYSDRRRSGDAGFNAHLNKPVDPMALLEIITRLRN